METETQSARKKRVQLISKWNNKRKSGSRDRSLTPELLNNQASASSKTRKSIGGGRRSSLGKDKKDRECLTPLANEPQTDSKKEQTSSTIQKPTADGTGKENKADEVPEPDGAVKTDEATQPNNNSITTENDVFGNGALPFMNGTMSPVSSVMDESPMMETTVADDLSQDGVLAVGDLVWAFLAGSPLWPAIITPDANEGVHTKLKQIPQGCTLIRWYHVEFFGDKRYHSWIRTSALILFEGGVHELLNSEEFQKHASKKTNLYKSLPQLGEKMVGKKKNWPLALEEAKKCFELPRVERIACLGDMIERREEEQKANRELKRKASVSENGEPKKKRQRRSVIATNVAEPKSVEEEEKVAELNEAATVEALLKQEDTADDDLKEFKKKREKEKKSPEMKIEVCERCSLRDGRLLPCDKCRTVYHAACIAPGAPESETLICPRCDPEIEPLCCLCDTPGDGDQPLMACNVKFCSRLYHQDCLQGFHLPSAKADRTPAQFTCPAHYCHTCVVELGELHQLDKKQPLLRCIECPTAYHSSESCLAAGCVQFSTTQMKCFKHVQRVVTKTKARKSAIHYNINWCLLCTQGGSLICCERCPSSFHTQCLKMEKEPAGSYLCVECTAGKAILHGDIVWCKIGTYRWWPGRVYPLDVMPVQHQRHKSKPGEFLVYFYGSHNSAFVHRGQVFHYQDGDQGSHCSGKSQTGEDYKLALELVAPVFLQRQKELANIQAERRFKINKKPPPYNKIRCNKPMGSVKSLESPEAASPCDCDEKKLDEPCGPDTNCLNRMLLIECSPNICSQKCANQRFQKRASPPLYPFNTGGKGWGLKSRADIKMGDFVIEYCGELIDNNEFQKRLKAKQDAQDEAYYFLTLDNHRMIDAGPSGNLSRFMNHSCQPNCETQKWTVLGDTRVGLFALRDIPADTELTFNYQLVCAQDVANESNKRHQPCHCGAPNCGGFIGAKPKQLEAEKGSKQGKGKKEKKKTRQKRKVKAETEDHCFRCYEGGELVMCDVKDCRKVYHHDCLCLPAPPKGHWTCPYHHCDECGKKAIQFCSVCPQSVCPTHAANAGWVQHETLGLLCKEHTSEDIEYHVKRRAGGDDETEGSITSTDQASPEPSTSSLSSEVD